MQTKKSFFLHVTYLLLACIFFTFLGCKPEAETGKQLITVWAHSGQEGERRVLMDQVQRFNEEFPDIHVELTLLPEGSYNSQLQSAALSHDLPDVIEFDGPFLYGYVWQNQLQPLDDLLPAAVQADLLPSIIKQGTMHDHLFAVGMFLTPVWACTATRPCWKRRTSVFRLQWTMLGQPRSSIRC